MRPAPRDHSHFPLAWALLLGALLGTGLFVWVERACEVAYRLRVRVEWGPPLPTPRADRGGR